MAVNTINGKDMYSAWGASFQMGAYAEFLTPPPAKDYLENKDRGRDGTQVLPNNPRVDEREINVNVTINASSEDELLNRYKSFIEEITKGWLVIHIPRLNATYRMLYVNSTRFGFYDNSLTVSIRLREPNPANRANE